MPKSNTTVFQPSQNHINTIFVKSHLANHKRMHTVEKPYKCDVCEKTLSSSSNLVRHKQSHTGDKPYKCDSCEKSFVQNSHLAAHKRIHTGNKPYKCGICEKTFARNSQLAVHEEVHTGLKPYKCNYCEKSFSYGSSLVKHKRSHTGEKPYECNVCDYSTTQKSDLAAHTRVHTGEKPYKCNICEKSFSHNSNLVKHKRSHTGEKPYKCDICINRFTRKDKLNAHKTIHTREKPSCELLRPNKTIVHLNINKRVKIDSSSNLNDNVTCEVETIKKETNKEESVDTPHPIHQEIENKDVDLYYHERIDIEEFKIEPGDVDINEEDSDQNNIINVNVNNTDHCSTKKSHLEYDKSVKLEDIKEEVKEEEIVDDPLYVQQTETFDNSNNNSVALNDCKISNEALAFFFS